MKKMPTAILITTTLAILLLLLYHDKRLVSHHANACSEDPKQHLVKIFNTYNLMYELDAVIDSNLSILDESSFFITLEKANENENDVSIPTMQTYERIPNIEVTINDPSTKEATQKGSGNVLTFKGNDYCLEAHQDGVIELFLNGVKVDNHNIEGEEDHYLKLIFTLVGDRILATYFVGHTYDATHNHPSFMGHNRSHGAAISKIEDKK